MIYLFCPEFFDFVFHKIHSNFLAGHPFSGKKPLITGIVKPFIEKGNDPPDRFLNE